MDTNSTFVRTIKNLHRQLLVANSLQMTSYVGGTRKWWHQIRSVTHSGEDKMFIKGCQSWTRLIYCYTDCLLCYQMKRLTSDCYQTMMMSAVGADTSTFRKTNVTAFDIVQGPKLLKVCRKTPYDWSKISHKN